MALAEEHLAAARLAIHRGLGVAAVGCAVAACRKVLVGLAMACGYEAVPSDTVPDAVFDAALVAVVATERPALAHLVQQFPAAVAYLESVGITEPPDGERTQRVMVFADALIDALRLEHAPPSRPL